MLSGTGYPSGENYPTGTGMELFFYPHAGMGNPMGKILWVRVQVGTTRRVCTRCHLELNTVEAELLSAREALKTEQHKHSELRTATELVCDALGVV
jgi:hypothetical protein